MSQVTKYLAIGHCCHDKTKGGYILGGTASYSSMLSQVLGAEATLLTSYGSDFLFEDTFKNEKIPIHNIASKMTTIFENKYVGDARTQTILARAETIRASDFITLNENFNIIHLSPIADEVDYDLIAQLDDEVITMATPQGWLRKWDETGKVSYKEINWELLSSIDFVIISEEDVHDLDKKLPEIKSVIKNLIVTKGEGGSVAYSNKVEAHFPAYPSKIIDPTGAGDTFATGFITRYAETRELVESMIFANCLASICIEHEGTSYFDHISDIEDRIKNYKANMLDLSASAPIRVK